MNEEIINCYQLDIKQDFPEDLRLAQIDSQSLKNKNQILLTILIAFGIGLSSFILLKRIYNKPPNEQNSRKKDI